MKEIVSSGILNSALYTVSFTNQQRDLKVIDLIRLLIFQTVLGQWRRQVPWRGIRRWGGRAVLRDWVWRHWFERRGKMWSCDQLHACARDRGLYCVCGIMGGRERGLFVDAGQKNLTVVTNKPCLSLNRFSSGIGWVADQTSTWSLCVTTCSILMWLLATPPI